VADAALVAGGAGALGGAVVDELRRRGWDVTVIDREPHPETSAPVAGGALRSVQADLLDPESAAAAVQSVEGLRAVVNLVGGFSMGQNVGETELDDFEFMLRLNLFPAFNLARAAMPLLAGAGGGAFVCVSARAALEPFAGAAGYITAKAGVLAFVRSLHAEYHDAGVRANAILPSVIDTPANRAAMPGADWTRWVEPAEIGRVVAALCSEDFTPTSGAAVPVYGRA